MKTAYIFTGWRQHLFQWTITLIFTVSLTNQCLRVWEDRISNQLLLLFFVSVFVGVSSAAWLHRFSCLYTCLRKEQRRPVWTAAGVLGVVWMLLLGVQLLPAPRGHTLTIRPLLKNSDEIVSIRPLSRGEGFFQEPWKAGWGWKYSANSYIHQGQEDGLLAWTGRTNRPLEINLSSNGKSGAVEFRWDGEPKIIILDRSTVGGISVRFQPENRGPVDWMISIALFAADWAALSVLSAILLIWLLTRDAAQARETADGRNWTLYGALILLPVFLSVWLAFYPAVFTADSVGQLSQTVFGQYSDSASAIHTLFLAALLQLWNNPAVLTLAQIGLSAAVLTWAVGSLGRQDRWSWALMWTVTAFAALLPFVNLLTVIIWKDIPYSLAFVMLFVLLAKIVQTRGRWIVDSGWSPWLLGFATVMVATLRHNGLLAGFATLVLLLWLGGKTLTTGSREALTLWRQSVMKALGAAVLLFILIKGPLYQVMHVSPMNSSWRYGPFMHQLGAMAAGAAELTLEERAYVNQIYAGIEPVSACDGRLPGYKQANMEHIVNNTGRFWQMYANLFFRNPNALISHLLCQNRTTLAIKQYEKPYHYSPLLDAAGKPVYFKVDQIIPEYKDVPEYQPNPVFPVAMHRLTALYQASTTPDPVTRISLWRPAVFLAIVILAVIVRALRCGRQWLWLLVPVLIHTASLIPLAHAYDSRYQYPVVLLGMLIWPWLFTRPDK